MNRDLNCCRSNEIYFVSFIFAERSLQQFDRLATASIISIFGVNSNLNSTDSEFFGAAMMFMFVCVPHVARAVDVASVDDNELNDYCMPFAVGNYQPSGWFHHRQREE